MNARTLLAPFALAGALMSTTDALADAAADRRAVAALDTAYQLAVERNDPDGMAKILHPQMTLVVWNGGVHSGAHLIEMARAKTVTYERQVEDEGTQTVRLFGPDTAVVTARLWLKGVQAGKAFDRRLWFSDTYVRTPQGWRYAFGQASGDLPPAAP